MVKPESSEDGVSAKTLVGEGAADSQGSKELEVSNLGARATGLLRTGELART